MGVREKLNDNPGVTSAVTIAIIIIVLIFIFWPSGGIGGGASGPGKMFFSDDDGKTWFPDDATKIPPFDHNGKQAVEAVVYKCDGKTFVNHLKRYTSAGKKKMEEINAKKDAMIDPSVMETIQSRGVEVKLPGAKDWVLVSNPKANEILKPHCKDLKNLEIVQPD